MRGAQFSLGDNLGRLPTQRGVRVDTRVTAGCDQFEEFPAGGFLGQTLGQSVDLGNVDCRSKASASSSVISSFSQIIDCIWVSSKNEV